MKKYLLSALLLLVSYFGFSQKGISYQAVILDPNKIEIPGQDITGQPFVNGNVWVKFTILSGNTTQFEEVQQTQTDAYGLVNLLIGSVSSASFNALVWDSTQKSLQVSVSFNQGASYIKVSDQKFSYTPYSLFAETAGKLGSILGIAGGGTGATTAVNARANLGLGNVDNTADVDKPISTATQAALNLKANSTDVNTALALKASAADVDLKAPIASPTFTGIVSGITKSMIGLGSVDNTSDVDKPISTATQEALDLKLNATGNAASATKLETSKKINGVAFDGSADITIAADASTLSGTVGIAKGGTGATTVAAARTNLGLVIGTDVQAPLTAGTDYLTPTGSAASLTSFPILNQSTTGNAATATLAGNVTATSNTTLTSLANLTSVGTVTSGTISLTTDITTSGALKAGTVTYPNMHGTSGQVLTTTGSGTLSWTSIANPDLTNYVTTNTAQTITGAKTFSETTTFSKDLAVNGITVGRGRLNVISNTASGVSALSLNTTGSYNTAIGYRTLSANTTGDNNTATGADALTSNTTGVYNTAYGSSTLLSNSTGSGNTAIGYSALLSNLTDGSSKGDNNTAIGNGALRFNTTGSNNTASGTTALINNSTGSGNTAIGKDAGSYLANGSTDNTTSDYSVYLGSNTKASADNAQNEIVIGYNAIGAGSNTIQLGNTAVMNVNTSGSITTGKDLRVNGIKVGIGGGNNVSNTVFGNEAFYSNLTGISNTVIGNNALFYSTGSNNTATGSGALFYNTGSNNTASGWRALFYNTTGSNNTAIGYNAGVADGNGTISNATAIGNGAIVAASNTIQLGNTAVTNVNTSGTITAAGMGLGVSTPTASAILEASSTTQGFLPPRLTTTQRDAIATPVAGLTIWNTTNTQLEVYDGSYWKNMVGLLVSPLNIGDTYGGGKVFYIFGPSDNGYIKGQTHGLIAAIEDQTTDAGVKWFPDKFYGATGTYIGLGLPNTLAIITSAIVTGTTNMSSFAAGLANSYRGGGNIDWFLPSKDELNLLYQAKDAIGGFATSGHPTYWSSTQKGGINLKDFASFVKGVESARTQFFFTTTGPDGKAAGTQSDLGIDNPRRVRAIRIF
jgi:hypothetical protein